MPLTVQKLFFALLAIRPRRSEEAHNSREFIKLRATTARAASVANISVLVSAHGDLFVETGVNNSAFTKIVQNLPRLIEISEISFYVDVTNLPSAALIVQNRA